VLARIVQASDTNKDEELVQLIEGLRSFRPAILRSNVPAITTATVWNMGPPECGILKLQKLQVCMMVRSYVENRRIRTGFSSSFV
jgi:hypothetical protein